MFRKPLPPGILRAEPVASIGSSVLARIGNLLGMRPLRSIRCLLFVVTPAVVAGCGLTFDGGTLDGDAGSVDATVPDASKDVGSDTGPVLDAGSDTGPVLDAGSDTGAPRDGAADVGADSGADAGSDCTNGVKDGNESGVDCGGACGNCLGALCGATAECAKDTVCRTTCQLPKSCLDLHTEVPSSTTGAYLLDADGTGVLPSRRYVCDMDFDGGGWTLILASNAKTALAEGTATQGTASYAPVAEVKAIAAASTHVHIRTAGDPTNNSITSASDAAITNLRAGNSPGQGMKNVAAATNWSGPLATDGRLKYSCDKTGNDAKYPNIYWACGLSNGLHLCSAGSTWSLNGEPPTALETWIR